MRIPFLLIAFGLLAFPGFGQTSPADTTYLQNLLAEGRRCLLKPGEDKVDLDSALRFADQAATLSRQIHNPRGIQEAAQIAANTYIEADRWSEAWRYYAVFNDTCRILFLTTMVNTRFTNKKDNADLDSVHRYIALITALGPAIRNPHYLASAFETAAAIETFGNRQQQAIVLWRQGWGLLRRLDDIAEESIYVWIMTFYHPKDGIQGLNLQAMIDQLEADDRRLLPAATSEVQREALAKWGSICNAYQQNKHIKEAIQMAQTGIRLNAWLHQHSAGAYFMLAELYEGQGRSTEALAVALDGFKVSMTPTGPPDGAGYECLTWIYFAMGSDDKCLEYFNQALPLLRKNPHLFIDPGGFCLRAVLVHLRNHRPAEALQQLRQMRRMSDSLRLGDNGGVAFAAAAARCFQALGRMDSAEYYWLRRLKFVEPHGFGAIKSTVYVDLASFYVAIHRYAKAKPLLDTLMADSNRALQSVNGLAILQLLRYRVDSAERDDHHALTDLRRYLPLHDSGTNVEKNKQLAEMDAKYESDKKNQHISDLEKQTALQARLQQATVRQDRIVRNSLIGGSILLALLAAGLYSRYRAKQRTNQLLETRQQEIDASNRQLQQLSTRQQKLIREKEWLVREIHHRVKNNLQIVISLLHLQSEQLKDEIAISAFEEISGRINSISLVHKKLYLEGDNLATINMGDYVSELVGHLRKSFSQRRDIHFRFGVGPIFLDVAQSVPIGLLLNEAITNAIKYAFPPEAVEYPEILISLKEEANGGLELRIADNGVGLKQPFDPEANNSLGMQLIHTMAQQLDGTLTIASDNGLTIAVRFQRTDAIPDQDLGT